MQGSAGKGVQKEGPWGGRVAGGRAAGGGPLAPMTLKNRRPIGRPSTTTTGSAAGTQYAAQGDGG